MEALNSKNPKIKFDRNLDIGSLEAEDDDFLLKSFVSKTDYQILSDTENQKCIILGRTGMGKSALIRKLCEDKDNCSKIKPEEMSLRFLSNSDILDYFRRLGISLDLFYKVLWKHVFIVEFLKLYYGEDKIKTGNKLQTLVESVDFKFNKKKKDAVEYLRKWHDKFWENTEYRIKEIEDTLRESLKRSLGVNAKLFDDFVQAKIGGEAEKIIQLSKKAEVIHKAQKVVNDIQLSEISTILDIIQKDLLPKSAKKFYIVIDDLDKHWVDKKIVYDLIVALILTIKEMNNCPNFKVIISLRLNLLQLALQKANTTGFQREKFENMFLHLYWDESELKTLLQNRVNTLFQNYNISTRVSIIDILPRDSGRGGKTDGFSYMLSRSFLRPRDLISFFNKAIKYSKGSYRINREAINLAESDYSLERLNAIEDEWNENYDLLHPYFSILKGKQFKFQEHDINWRDLERFCKSLHNKTRSKELRSITNYGWKKHREHDTKRHLLNVLYKIGCIGIKPTPDSKLMYSFHYSNTLDSFDLSPSFSYYINPALYKALLIKSDQDKSKPQSNQ